MKNDFEFFNPTSVFWPLCHGESVLRAFSVWRSRFAGLRQRSFEGTGYTIRIMNTLQACGKTVTEFSGILPNPTYEKVLEGGRLARASKQT